MNFDWDSKKAHSNFRKHRVSFDEAATVFLDAHAVSGPDPDHSVAEERYITFGHSRLGRLLAVCHTYRPGTIRIISARRVTRGERKIYEEG
ncbi:MAG TPA: BrnT family toxin [Burkholderiales bacterium]|nr:BrnT family toxin [Betaproteobacteria bacterium]HQR54148.1 BrnT family toxin [Burkholderiales bacterium]